MISFHQNGRCFHLRAGGIALHEDHVLLHRLDGDEFWAIPGGRVEMGEQAGETLIREFHEELGIHVTTGDLVCVATRCGFRSSLSDLHVTKADIGA